MTFSIQFWGVRGSIAAPGPSTAQVGGNTSCVEVRCGDTRLVLDAGTGLRGLGEDLLRQGTDEIALFLSHTHWDHIQGLPFFVPLYVPNTRIAVYAQLQSHASLPDVLARQMSAPVFPVSFAELASRVATHELHSGARFAVGPAQVTAQRLNHPGGVLAYRIDYGGRSVVYATDTEHYACVDPALLALARGCDVLIYDSQYTPDEYSGASGPAKVGWGHSTYVAGAELARAAGVGRYLLFHHDPKRSDAQVAELESAAQRLFPDALAAREGLILDLDCSSQRAA